MPEGQLKLVDVLEGLSALCVIVGILGGVFLAGLAFGWVIFH